MWEQNKSADEWMGYLRIKKTNVGIKRQKSKRKIHKWNRWWQYDDQNHKRAEHNQKDKLNHQWTSISLGRRVEAQRAQKP